MENKVFAEVLRKALAVAEITPSVLAKELGVSRAIVYRWLSGALPSHKHARALGVRLGLWVPPASNWDPSSSAQRRVRFVEPKLAIGGCWSVDRQSNRWLEVDEGISAQAIAFRIPGDAMEPEFSEGEIVIIDPSIEPRDGDYIVAEIPGHGQKQPHPDTLLFHQFRARGHHLDQPVYDLVPLNPSHSTKTIGADNHGRIVGTLVEHRRRFRIKNS
jgi:Peptidase S24-like